MIRKIVMPVRGDGKGDNVFAHAAALAARFRCHIVVTHCRARAEDMMPYGVPIPATLKKLLVEQSGAVADQVEGALRAELVELASSLHVTLSDVPIEGQATVSMVEQQGRQVDVIKRHGRLADLICVAKPDLSRNLGSNTLKAALFNTGRPVMMCPVPSEPIQTLCERLTIGWNGSTEASRAVAMTLPLIEAASEVIVLSSGPTVHGADADDLAEYLSVRGVEARVERFPEKKRIGDALVSHSARLGADTLIMGAYSDSHERETVFGGNTQQVVDDSPMPVILVH